MMKKILLFISFLWSFSLLAKVEASLDLEKAVVGDHLRLSLIIEGSPDSISQLFILLQQANLGSII
jgi:hypothetical protein